MNILNPRRDFSITVDGYTFFGLIPLPKDELTIDLNVARRLQGMPLQSIPSPTYQYTVMAETLNVAIREKPGDLDQLKDWMDHPDPDFVQNVFEKYGEKKAEFFASLKKNSQRPAEHAQRSGHPNGSLPAEQVSRSTGGAEPGQPVPGPEMVSGSVGSTPGRPPGTPAPRPRNPALGNLGQNQG